MERSASFPDLLPYIAEQLPTLKHIAAAYLYRGDDIARIERLDSLARTHGLALLATNDVHYHVPERRALQDVMTAIRHKTTVAAAGHLLHPNAERHLKSPEEMMRLFARWPHVPLVFLFSACIGGEASARFVSSTSVGASGGLMGWLGFLLVFESLHARLVPRSARRRTGRASRADAPARPA